jgi:hypothetical protein
MMAPDERGLVGFDRGGAQQGLHLQVDVHVPVGGPKPGLEKDRTADIEQRTRSLDEAVARELEGLAAGDVWEGPAKAPEDPFAPKLVLKTDRCDGVRHVVVGVRKASPTQEDVAFEIHKRIG